MHAIPFTDTSYIQEYLHTCQLDSQALATTYDIIVSTTKDTYSKLYH